MSDFNIIITGGTDQAAETDADTTEDQAVVDAARVFVSTLPGVTEAEITTDSGAPVSLLPEPSVADKLLNALAAVDVAVKHHEDSPGTDTKDALDHALADVDDAAQAAVVELRAKTPPVTVAPAPGAPAPAPGVDANGGTVNPTTEAAAHAAATVAI